MYLDVIKYIIYSNINYCVLFLLLLCGFMKQYIFSIKLILHSFCNELSVMYCPPLQISNKINILFCTELSASNFQQWTISDKLSCDELPGHHVRLRYNVFIWIVSLVLTMPERKGVVDEDTVQMVAGEGLLWQGFSNCGLWPASGLHLECKNAICKNIITITNSVCPQVKRGHYMI